MVMVWRSYLLAPVAAELSHDGILERRQLPDDDRPLVRTTSIRTCHTKAVMIANTNNFVNRVGIVNLGVTRSSSWFIDAQTVIFISNKRKFRLSSSRLYPATSWCQQKASSPWLESTSYQALLISPRLTHPCIARLRLVEISTILHPGYLALYIPN